MLVIPAIDIKDGCVVRLLQGNFSSQKIYSRDPLKTARHWARQGAELLHIVDLDGARTGVCKNLQTIEKIVTSVDVPVEFGGGIRSLETIKKIVDWGVYRVVLGTMAVEDEDFLKKAIDKFKDKIIVSVDSRSDAVLIKGWQKSSACITKFVQRLKGLGLKQIIYTDVLKDGTLKGPNVKGIKNLLKETKMKIIASGGIGSLDDISRLKLLEKQGLIGIIVGKALYEGRFTLAQAIKIGGQASILSRES